MNKYEKLRQDKELMADFRACMKYRREHMQDAYEFFLAKKYDIGFIDNMQRMGLLSIWVWLPLFYFFPQREAVLWSLLHISLVVHWDNWWGQAFSGHQHFDYFSREELNQSFGESWEDGPADWTKFRKIEDDDQINTHHADNKGQL